MQQFPMIGPLLMCMVVFLQGQHQGEGLGAHCGDAAEWSEAG
jgi:preprotein translocase subunit SecG